MYKRILIKLSGESLMGDVALIDKEKTKEIAKVESSAVTCSPNQFCPIE